MYCVNEYPIVIMNSWLPFCQHLIDRSSCWQIRMWSLPLSNNKLIYPSGSRYFISHVNSICRLNSSFVVRGSICEVDLRKSSFVNRTAIFMQDVCQTYIHASPFRIDMSINSFMFYLFSRGYCSYLFLDWNIKFSCFYSLKIEN